LSADAPDGPFISVIVPTHDRPVALSACLRALAAQTLSPGAFEIIICDDGSTPAVALQQAGLLAELADGLRVRVVRQENAGPAAARNLGAAAARGRYLAFTDDDCEPAPDWLERLLTHHEKRPGVLLGGAMRNGLAANVYAAATHAIMDFVYAEHWRYSESRLFSTSNLSLPAEGFRAIGGFSPEFPDAAGEDYDLCWRWQESGGHAEYAPDAVIVHNHALTFRDYARQHFRYGRGLLRVRRRQKERARRKRTARAGFYLRLVLHPLQTSLRFPAWRCAALIGISQIVTALGATVELVHPSKRRNAARDAVTKQSKLPWPNG
jgi:GT2 family glycosyltransferase